MASKARTVLQKKLNNATPGAREALLGDVIYDLVNAHNDLRAKYLALLAHVDAGNVTGIGNGNTAAYSPTLPAVLLPEARPNNA